MVQDYPRHDHVMERRGLHAECTWKLGAKDNDARCPHRREVRDHTKKIKESIVDCIGNTPMVKVNNLAKTEGLECELLVKCEFLNPGGSMKDRIGRRMIMDAETEGRVKKGDIIVEPTSGNTGVALSMVAAAMGYRMITTMPERMSQEKEDALAGLGATVVRCPNLPGYHRDGYVGTAIKLARTLEGAHCLDQYSNPSNPIAHYDETAEEIWDQCDGKIDYMFIGAGTGGTLTGISRKLKEKDPSIKIIAIDPVGSILAPPEQNGTRRGGFKIEGIGKDYIPRTMDRTLTDGWVKCEDKEGHVWARRLLKEEGLMVGGSCGSAVWGAVQYIKDNKIGKGKRCVVLLPDNLRNYMSKHLNNDWMYEQGYMTEQECA